MGVDDQSKGHVPSQIQQTWSRILFGAGGLLYLWSHGDFMPQYESIFLPSAALYFIYNALTLYHIRQTPLSAFRMLFGPLLDVWVVSLGMMVDGGQTSGLYLIFFVIIFGNAVRFGNSMLLYGQALSIIGIILVSLTTLFGLQLDLDGTLLMMQCIALMVIPAYVLQIKRQANLAMKEKREAEEATFGLLEHGPLPAFTYHIDKDGSPQILHTNLAIQHIHREPPSSLIGNRVDVLALMEDGEEIVSACQQVFSNEQNHEPCRFYIRGRDSNDNILQLMGQSMRLHWRSKWIGVCFLLDISQSEAARSELKESMQSSYMNTLVAGIVHDFRNILTSIIGTAEVMSFSIKDETIQHQLKLIMDAGERGSSMTSQLLKLSKGKHEQALEAPTSEIIHQSLTSIIGLMRIQLPPHIQLHLDVDKDLPVVAISITEIEQIVSNLINNSSQAIAKTGHIGVHIRSAEKGEKGENEQSEALCIQVKDNGNGIPEEALDDVTKPFWTSRKEQGGTGLGLAMVQRIVRNNHGTMEIDSHLEKGTDIRIFLPSVDKTVSQQEAESIEKEAPSVTREDEETSPEQLEPIPAVVLLVDDNPEVLDVHQAQLERMGHTVLTAMDGASGLQRYAEHADKIELVVTDYKMPEMDGMDFSTQLLQQRPDLPILIITAYGDIEKLQKTKELGIHILNKPATFKKLSHTIALMQKTTPKEIQQKN